MNILCFANYSLLIDSKLFSDYFISSFPACNISLIYFFGSVITYCEGERTFYKTQKRLLKYSIIMPRTGFSVGIRVQCTTVGLEAVLVSSNSNSPLHMIARRFCEKTKRNIRDFLMTKDKKLYFKKYVDHFEHNLLHRSGQLKNSTYL